MSYTTLDLRREGPLAWLTLDRPQQLNAMNETLVAMMPGLDVSGEVIKRLDAKK